MLNKSAPRHFSDKALPLTSFDDFIELLDAAQNQPSLAIAVVYYHACLVGDNVNHMMVTGVSTGDYA